MAALFGNPISHLLGEHAPVQHFPLELQHPGFVSHPVGPPIQIHGFGPGGAVTGTNGGPISATGGPIPTPEPVTTVGAPASTHGVLGTASRGEKFPVSADEANASNVAQHLLSALSAAKDPNLRESLSNALAAIHKHISGLQKERHQALQGKLSPRLMEAAHGINHGAPNAGGARLPLGAPAPGQHIDQGYNPAQVALANGNTAQAAADWEAHHPYAMSHGQLPDWLNAYLAAQVAARANQIQAAGSTAPAQNTFAAQ